MKKNRTCGESTDVVMKTVKAAASQTYPERSYQVFVLDDGQDDSLRQAIEHLDQTLRLTNPGRLPVVYLSRKKTTSSTYYKSGNIRFGLDKTVKSHGGSRYIAILDADMVPERTWLERTVRPLENNLHLSMAGPPQQFHNVPTGDLLGQDTGVFAQILEPLRDRFGCSQCCGSGFVMRREALDSIGGWPLCNVGEDVICSFALMDAGWRTAHVNERLQSGVVAGSFHAYVAQRIRWVSHCVRSTWQPGELTIYSDYGQSPPCKEVPLFHSDQRSSNQ
jgi:cellulose synthase/poly-beta-1,6-N-acetylglucosamine synthase-like glycosyltransferase